MKFKKNVIVVIIILLFLITFIILFKRNDDCIIYEKNNSTYLYHNNKITPIRDSDDLHLLNKNYYIYSKNNKLYLYSIKKRKKQIISKNYKQLVDYSKYSVIYSTKNHSYLYDIRTNKYKKIDGFNDIKFALDNNYLLYYKDKKLIVYNYYRNKIIKKVADVSSYYCINDNCSKLYFIKNKTLYKYDNSIKEVEKNIYSLLWSDNNSVIFQVLKDNKFILYYKDNNKKSIKLDSNVLVHSDVFVDHSTIMFISGGNYIKVNKNGKNRKIISRSVEKIIDVYRGKALLYKSNSLYLDNVLLDENILIDSVFNNNGKLFYLKKGKAINSLIESNTKKRKIINKNVFDIYNNYYLGDYHLHYKYGNIYSINNSKIIDRKVSRIIDYK